MSYTPADTVMTLAGLDPEMTVAAFQELLASRLSVPAVYQELLAGFPPKLVQVWHTFHVPFNLCETPILQAVNCC